MQNTNNIIQFICFITRLDLDEFAGKWKHYAKQSAMDPNAMTLQQDVSGTSRYKYISWQECRDEDFKFAFMKGRNSEHFPERNVKVVQVGGYTPVQLECRHADSGDVKVLAMISHDETDIGFYNGLPLYHYLNIYQAYYESCTYAYILEYFLPQAKVADLLQQLKTRNGTETALYRECPVPKI